MMQRHFWRRRVDSAAYSRGRRGACSESRWLRALERRDAPSRNATDTSHQDNIKCRSLPIFPVDQSPLYGVNLTAVISWMLSYSRNRLRGGKKAEVLRGHTLFVGVCLRRRQGPEGCPRASIG